MPHTPGPWQWVTGPTLDPLLVAADYKLGDFFVLAPEEWGGDEAVNEANARLIAAAPDLVRELRSHLDWLASYPGEGAMSIYNRTRALLASIDQASGC